MTKDITPPFIIERLKIGIPQQEIKKNLISVGWTEEDADEVLMLALLELGAPVPKSGLQTKARKNSSTLDIVLNFFSFILLAISATALGVLYYQIINKILPDPLLLRTGVSGFSTSTLLYAIAGLVVAFPAYGASVYYWFKRFRENTERAESKLTKWITYLVVLIASVTIIGDLIFAVFYALQGELTARFFLKALTILVIAGAIIGFYYLERRKVQYGQDIPRKVFQLFGYVMSAVVVVGIVLGFVMSGSPKTERAKGLDIQRATDLSDLAGCINNFTQERKRLPKDLAELQSSTNYQYCALRADPETAVAYEYAIITPAKNVSGVSEGVYELCATFSLESTKNSLTEQQNSYYTAQFVKWGIHPAGRVCKNETTVIASDAQKI